MEKWKNCIAWFRYSFFWRFDISKGYFHRFRNINYFWVTVKLPKMFLRAMLVARNKRKWIRGMNLQIMVKKKRPDKNGWERCGLNAINYVTGKNPESTMRGSSWNNEDNFPRGKMAANTIVINCAKNLVNDKKAIMINFEKFAAFILEKASHAQQLHDLWPWWTLCHEKVVKTVLWKPSIMQKIRISKAEWNSQEVSSTRKILVRKTFANYLG